MPRHRNRRHHRREIIYRRPYTPYFRDRYNYNVPTPVMLDQFGTPIPPWYVTRWPIVWY